MAPTFETAAPPSDTPASAGPPAAPTSAVEGAQSGSDPSGGIPPLFVGVLVTLALLVGGLAGALVLALRRKPG